MTPDRKFWTWPASMPRPRQRTTPSGPWPLWWTSPLMSSGPWARGSPAVTWLARFYLEQYPQFAQRVTELRGAGGVDQRPVRHPGVLDRARWGDPPHGHVDDAFRRESAGRGKAVLRRRLCGGPARTPNRAPEAALAQQVFLDFAEGVAGEFFDQVEQPGVFEVGAFSV